MRDSLPEGGDGAAARVAAAPRWAVIGIFLILAVFALASASNFLMPLILAFLLALVFTPLRRSMNRIGVSSPVCAMVIIVVLSASVVAGIVTLSGPVARWAADAPTLGYQLEAKIRSLREPVAQIAEAGEQIDKLAEGESDPGTETVEVKGAGFNDRLAALAPQIGAQAAFVLVLLFFLIASGDMFYEKVVHVLPTFTDKRRAMRIAIDVERRLARYLSTITLINALLGVAIGTSMWLIGMPSPMLFGVLGFLLNFIPYVGAIAGVVLATAIALLTFPDPWWSLVAGGTYLALTSIEGQLITPYFVGRILQLNTVVVFVSVAFWAWLWSVVGMIIAVPVLVVVRVFAEHIEALEPLGDFLSARGAETEPLPPAEENGSEPEPGDEAVAVPASAAGASGSPGAVEMASKAGRPA